MDNIEESLVKIGLTATEAKIYLAGNGADLLTIQELGKRTKIKRPTIYHAIGTLAEKGLVAEKRTGSKSRFSMSAPEHIQALIESQREVINERAERLSEIMPLLAQQKRSDKKEDVTVTQYSGIDGMKMVMDVAFYCRSKHWEIIAPYHNFLREYDKAYAERYLNVRKYHNITSRTLWEYRTSDDKKLTRKEIEERNPRIMPQSMRGKFKSMMIIFDDKVAILSSYEGLSAMLISSKELHNMFLAMFDSIWEQSEQYK